MIYANEAVQALLKGDLVNVIVNQNNTNQHIGDKVFAIKVHAVPSYSPFLLPEKLLVRYILQC